MARHQKPCSRLVRMLEHVAWTSTIPRNRGWVPLGWCSAGLAGFLSGVVPVKFEQVERRAGQVRFGFAGAMPRREKLIRFGRFLICPNTGSTVWPRCRSRLVPPVPEPALHASGLGQPGRVLARDRVAAVRELAGIVGERRGQAWTRSVVAPVRMALRRLRRPVNRRARRAPLPCAAPTGSRASMIVVRSRASAGAPGSTPVMGRNGAAKIICQWVCQ
jgi:hypothetical protein